MTIEAYEPGGTNNRGHDEPGAKNKEGTRNQEQKHPGAKNTRETKH